MSAAVIGIRIHNTSYALAVDQILSWASGRESRLVFAANVHMLMEAYDSPAFRAVVNNGDLAVPDGMPLVWMLRLKGHNQRGRVYGPTLMLHTIERAAREGVAVGFYGGSPKTLKMLLDRMHIRYPGLSVAYSFSPAFREMSHEEDEKICEAIRTSEARILFIGLGCPKQERWMAEHHGRIQAVMIGVGAAFDFHAGVKPQAPRWMQSIGLEWLYRLLVEPRRLWRRYFHHNPRFIFLAIADLLGITRYN